MPRKLRLAAAIPVVLLLAVASQQVARTAKADHIAREDTLGALARAEQYSPDDAAIRARIAALDPTRDDEIQHALELNPRDPTLWGMRSIHQEEAGDLDGAEKSLEQALSVSRYFAPRWSLTAFYYRQNNVPLFIQSARQTLSSGVGDDRSVFQMAKHLGMSPSEIEDKLIPDSVDVVKSFLGFTTEVPDLDAEMGAAQRLLRLEAEDSKASLDSVMAVCNALILAGRPEDAVVLWNGMVRAKWIDANPLDPNSGIILTDGTFAKPRLRVGFDWRFLAPPTVDLLTASPSGIELDFDTREPEQCELMAQYIPLLPGRYVLKTQLKSSITPEETGLTWSIRRMTPKGHEDISLPGLPGTPEATQLAPFEISREGGPYQLVLSYARVPETYKLRGKLTIQSVELELKSSQVTP